MKSQALFHRSPAFGSVALSVFVLSLLAVHAASAQTADTEKVAKATGAVTDTDPMLKNAGDLLGDAYQPHGLELGKFLLYPRINAGEGYNSNIYASPTAKSDFVTTLSPDIELRSRFDQHQLDANISLQQLWYARYGINDVTNVAGNLNGRYDIDRNSDLSLSVMAYSSHEAREVTDAVQSLEPTPTQGVNAQFGYETHIGKYTFGATGNIDRYGYGNVIDTSGFLIDNVSRNRTEYSGTLRGAYEFSPGYAAVASGTINRREYDSHDTFGADRTSTGYDIETGFGLDLTNVLRGDLLIGYLQQNYRDPRVADPSGVEVKAVLNWTPTKLTLIAPSIERTVEESTIVGSSGVLQTAYNLLIQHEYAKNVVMRGFFSYKQQEYPGIPQHMNSYEFDADVTYAIIPELDLTALVGYRKRDSVISTLTYDQVTTSLTLALRM